MDWEDTKKIGRLFLNKALDSIVDYRGKKTPEKQKELFSNCKRI